jgi:hypothetical protein
MLAVLTLLGNAGLDPVAIGAAMLQGTQWRQPLEAWQGRILAPLTSPRLVKSSTGRWLPE